MGSLTLTRHNLFHNENHRRATHSFAPRLLIFKLQQEILKFIDICVSRSSPKPDLETNFLSLGNRSFESISFSRDLEVSISSKSLVFHKSNF